MPPFQRVRPPRPQPIQIIILVAVQSLLEFGASADAADGDRRDGFTDDGQGARILDGFHPDKDSPRVPLGQTKKKCPKK